MNTNRPNGDLKSPDKKEALEGLPQGVRNLMSPNAHRSGALLSIGGETLLNGDEDPENPPVVHSAAHDALMAREIATYNRKLLFLSVAMTYAATDTCWQLTYDQLSVLLDNSWKYIGGNVALGAVSSAVNFVTTSIPARLTQTMARPIGWDVASTFLTNALWQPMVDLGSNIGEQASWARNAATSAILGVGTKGILVGLRKLREKITAPEVLEQHRVDNEHKAVVSDLADMASAVGFYNQGVAPLPGSPSGNRNPFYAGLFSGVSAAVGQAGSELWKWWQSKKAAEDASSYNSLSGPPSPRSGASA